jgi:hypothetical protein
MNLQPKSGLGLPLWLILFNCKHVLIIKFTRIIIFWLRDSKYIKSLWSQAFWIMGRVLYCTLRCNIGNSLENISLNIFRYVVIGGEILISGIQLISCLVSVTAQKQSRILQLLKVHTSYCLCLIKVITVVIMKERCNQM